MAHRPPNGRDYREARQRAAFALVGLVVAIVMLHSLGLGAHVDPLILSPILLTAAGLLAVDLPGLGR
ncbi:MAG: hypothetical protein U9O18_01330 [Chloroflexota bacterium]|nr:hypothetical protein [Chloroflexota bacterium]